MKNHYFLFIFFFIWNTLPGLPAAQSFNKETALLKVYRNLKKRQPDFFNFFYLSNRILSHNPDSLEIAFYLSNRKLTFFLKADQPLPDKAGAFFTAAFYSDKQPADGQKLWIYSNGFKAASLYYTNSLPSGICRYYNSNNRLFKAVYYSNGLPVSNPEPVFTALYQRAKGSGPAAVREFLDYFAFTRAESLHDHYDNFWETGVDSNQIFFVLQLIEQAAVSYETIYRYLIRDGYVLSVVTCFLRNNSVSFLIEKVKSDTDKVMQHISVVLLYKYLNTFPRFLTAPHCFMRNSRESTLKFLRGEIRKIPVSYDKIYNITDYKSFKH
ncbi:MAG TPA: hypothetical protein VKS21_11320 [Spirochaetota bacterium]|nr:hypothetical protein [Spirochaetota bacterium]